MNDKSKSNVDERLSALRLASASWPKIASANPSDDLLCSNRKSFEWKRALFVFLLFAGTGFFARPYVDNWFYSQPNSNSEFDEIWLGIDLMAAHPDDPEKPEDVLGVSDIEIIELDQESVDLLLSDETIEAAMFSEHPRHAFALGRVAMLHAQHETAFELLSLAAEMGSAPAHLYLADYFEDDLEQAMELIETSIALGFEPAKEVRDAVAAIMQSPPVTAQGEAPNHITAPLPTFDLTSFHQPALLQAMYDGRSNLDLIDCKVPLSAPDFILNAEGEPLVNQMVSTLYACHLAITLQQKASEENPIYLPEGVPKLAHMIDANTSSVALNRLDTEDMLLITKGVGIIRRLGMVNPVIEGAEGLFTQPPTLESLKNTSTRVFHELIEQDKRTKSTERFADSVKDQAVLDAIRLQDMYYSGNTQQVQQLYRGLQGFILENHQ